MTLLKIDEHTSKLEEMDVEGILAFAERVLPRTADLWVQASLDQRQRLQQLFFPQGVALNGNGFVGTAVTAPAFSYLQPVADGKERMVDQTIASWNLIDQWLREVDVLRTAGEGFIARDWPIGVTSEAEDQSAASRSGIAARTQSS